MMMGIQFEAIRPPEFNKQFYRPYLLAAMRESLNEVLKLYKLTTKYWKIKPVFEIVLSTIGEIITASAYTSNPIYKYVDCGVKGHPIYPRKRRVSGTSGTYVKGSLPGTLETKPSRKTRDGRYLNLNWVVPWPGIKARGFTKQISEKVTKEQGSQNLRTNLQIALNKSAAKVWK